MIVDKSTKKYHDTILGGRLEQIRKLTKRNQTSFASLLDRKKAAISKWENGDAVPRWDTIVDILKVVEIDTGHHISAHWLLTGTGPMELPVEKQRGEKTNYPISPGVDLTISHVAESDRLTSDIRRVINYLKGMDEPTREAALQILATLTHLKGDED